MATAPLTTKQLQEAVDTFFIFGSKTAAADALGVNRATFTHRIHVAKQRGIKPKPGLKKPVKPKPHVLNPQDQPTFEDSIKAQRINTDRAETKARLKEATKRIIALEERIKELEWGSNLSLKPAEWTRPERSPHKSEHTPYLLTSDFQCGEVVRAEETEAGYGYDSNIFRQRYRHLIDTVIYLSTAHVGSSWVYPGIIYARGGDSLSGGIHEELRETDDLTPIEAVECVFEEEAAGIEKLLEAFGKVEVKTPGAAGNHDRNTFKPQTKRADAHSYDRLIAYMLRRHFNGNDKVTFQTSQSFDVRFPIYTMNILLSHGDRIGSRGGQGLVGPAATIMRGAQKTILEQAALGHRVDRIDMGHFHQFLYYGWVLSNGSMPGYSEFAKSMRMRPSPPIQTLLYHHPRHGCVDIRPITLANLDDIQKPKQGRGR